MPRLLVLLAALLIAELGCRPQTTPEMGEILYEVPTVPGGSEPYQLPDLSSPPTNDGDEPPHEHSNEHPHAHP